LEQSNQLDVELVIVSLGQRSICDSVEILRQRGSSEFEKYHCLDQSLVRNSQQDEVLGLISLGQHSTYA
jgi:hypothetical protein